MSEPVEKSHKRLWLIVSSLLLLALGIWLFSQSIARGPVYGGRPWSYWMAQLRPNIGPDASSPGFRLTDEGIAAVQEVGARELDTVVELIAKPSSGPKALILGMLTNDRIPDQVTRLLGLMMPQSYNPPSSRCFLPSPGITGQRRHPEGCGNAPCS